MAKASSKSDNELLQEISTKLSQLIAINGIAGKEKREQIKYLAAFDFTMGDIARIVGVPEGTVGRIRAELKKKA